MKDPTNSPRVREKEFGVSRASLMALMVKNPPQCRRLGFDLWVRKIPWRRERLPTPVFSFREFHRQRSLVGYSSWGLKESDVAEQVILWFFLDANDTTSDEWVLLASQIIQGSGESWGASGTLIGSRWLFGRIVGELNQEKKKKKTHNKTTTKIQTIIFLLF